MSIYSRSWVELPFKISYPHKLPNSCYTRAVMSSNAKGGGEYYSQNLLLQ